MREESGWLFFALVVLLGGCGASSGPRVDAAPTWDAIHPLFLPSPLALRDAIGLSGAAPIGKDATSTTVRRVDLAAMAKSGLGTERVDLTWASIEPLRGHFDFTPIDEGIGDLLAAHVEPQPILDYGNGWATAASCGDDFYPPDQPADFASYVTAVVSHLRGKGIAAYEIWNEENLGLRFWHPHEDPVGYAALLEAAAAAVRAADPTAAVLFGGVLLHGQANLAGTVFLDEVYQADAKIGAAFDVVCIHPYANYPPVVPPEYAGGTDPEPELPEPLMVAQVRDVMAWHGDGGKPIWATEIGWPSLAPVSEAMQARWLVRSILLLLASGATKVDWYNLEDGDDPKTLPPENHFGLFEYAAPGSPLVAKPGWVALSALLATCGALHLTADLRTALPLPSDGYAYRLEGSGKRVTILWRADEAQPAVPLAVPVAASQVAIMALDGTTTTPPPGSTVTVPLGAAPVYVVETL